ncbi:Hypothetical predicted protein, partial [Marmota monax]
YKVRRLNLNDTTLGALGALSPETARREANFLVRSRSDKYNTYTQQSSGSEAEAEAGGSEARTGRRRRRGCRRREPNRGPGAAGGVAASASELGPGSREGGACAHDSQGLAYCGGRRRSLVLGWGLRREGHAAGQAVETPLPGAPLSRGHGLGASGLTAAFVRSASSLPLPQPLTLPRSGRPALAP